jgi:hypothetical protein
MNETTVSGESVKHDIKNTSPLTRYDSNPFTAAWSGIQKLVRTNAQTVVGVALFNILLFVILGLTTLVVVLSVFAFVAKHFGPLPTFPSYTAFDFLNSMNDTSIYFTWGIGFALCASVVALVQSLQLNLTLAATKNIPLKFGKLLKASIGSIGAILGFGILILLAIIAVSVALGLLAAVLGPITFVIALVAILAIVYVGLRLSFTPYSIVEHRTGPIAAIKNSWRITNGHVIETVGSAAVAWLVLAVPSLVINALARITEGASVVSGLFSLLDIALVVVLVIGAAMAIAERYIQIQAVANKELETTPLSPFNYLAVVLVLILAPILQLLSPGMKTGTDQTFPGLNNTSLPTQDPIQNPSSETLYPTTLN